MDFQKEYRASLEIIENRLQSFFLENKPQKELFAAMRYSLLAGGKRIRPVLVMKFCEATGGAPMDALDLGCGVEMLHTYSLIHDDLPCMDDDDLRRGKPTNHKVFGECTAVLAGDALQAAAFETVLAAPLSADKLVKAAKILADAAGEDGICGGQILDIAGENKVLMEQDLLEIHERKTASMIKASCLMGAIAGAASDEQLRAAEAYAENIGLAFQIRDDILDVTSTVEELGKPIGSDAECGKNTYYTLFGAEACEKIIAEKTENAIKAVSRAFPKPDFLIWLAKKLADRKK